MTNHETASPARILVVDDEPSARAALTELLRDEGYEVQSAGDGHKALARVDGWDPDVVITDVKMPALGGLELMAELRARLPEVAVIVMTAFGSTDGAVEAMQLGADDYLSKPINLSQLLLILKRTLVRRALQREAAMLREALAERDRAPAADAAPVVPGSSLQELVRFAILKTLEHVGGSTSKAAQILGVSPRKIQYRVQEYRATGSAAGLAAK